MENPGILKEINRNPKGTPEERSTTGGTGRAPSGHRAGIGRGGHQAGNGSGEAGGDNM